MSFGESMFSAGFIQKTTKEDVIVEGNYGIPPWHLRGKTLEGSRRKITEAGLDPLPCGAVRPIGGAACPPVGPTYQSATYVGSLPPLRVHLSRCLSRFDPRAHVGPSGLYILAPAPSLSRDPKTLIYILLMRIRASYQEKIRPP